MGNKVNVLHVIGSMNCGGAEMMLMNLYHNIDRRKVQFDFVEHTDEKALYDDEIEKMGGKIYHCPRFTGKNYLEYRQWWDVFFKDYGKQYNIVHGHIGSSAAIYLKCAKDNGKFTIAHSHNTKGTWSFKEIAYRLLSRRVTGVADAFFACSKAAGRDRFGRNIAFLVLNNAIDTEKYLFSEQIREEARRELGIKSEFVVGHVGRFNYQKNHEFLIDIFEELIRKGNNNIKLLLVGDGEEKEYIKNKVKRLNLLEKVIFVGIRSDVERLLQAMDIFVFPSLFEGLPVSVVEAQAAGLLCVISNRVPAECIITKDLVTTRDLTESATSWAQHIMDKSDYIRRNTYDEIKDHGFDIAETVRWLEEFYIEHAER